MMAMVDFYISDPSDAIIQAYSSAYPDYLNTWMKCRLNYVNTCVIPVIFDYLQMKVYAKYHQRDPALFYEQAETWQFANVRGQSVLPYYQTMDFVTVMIQKNLS